jgi:hypothetical protein
VIARQPAGLAHLLGQPSRGRRAHDPQGKQDPLPQRMGQRLQQRRVDLDTTRFHLPTIEPQTYLCKYLLVVVTGARSPEIGPVPLRRQLAPFARPMWCSVLRGQRPVSPQPTVHCGCVLLERIRLDLDSGGQTDAGQAELVAIAGEVESLAAG